MAHNRTTQYSAPFRRNNLLSLQQYAASEQFPSLGSWDRARLEDLYVVRGTVGRNQPVHIMVVGVITSDKANLQPHGNYDPTFMPKIETVAKKAKLQFIISNPADDPDFSEDYAVALRRLQAIQEEVAGSPSRREHFIDGQTMKMNFNLFSEKEPIEVLVEDTSSEDELMSSRSEEGEISNSAPVVPKKQVYEVASPYRHTWEMLSETHDTNIMEVYGVDENPIDYRQFSKHLSSGTTVVVTFELKHYAIRERGTTNIVSDTFTASVVSVSILKEAEKKVRSSTVASPKRRPLPVSQTPSRKTLKFAADAFSPVRTRVEASTSTKSSRAIRDVSPPSPSLAAVNVVAGSSTQRGLAASPSAAPSSDLPNNLAMMFSREMLESMIPLLLERMKKPLAEVIQGRSTETASVERDGSSSPTISSASSPSPGEVLAPSPVGVNPGGDEAVAASCNRDEDPSAPLDSTWVNVEASDTAKPGSATASYADPTASLSADAGSFIVVNEELIGAGDEEVLPQPTEQATAPVKKGRGSSAAQGKKEGKRRA